MILAKNHFICLFLKNMILDNQNFYNYKYACILLLLLLRI